MSLLDEMYEDGQNNRQEELKKINTDAIKRVQSFLKSAKATRWKFVYLGFGNQLIKDEEQKFYEKDKIYSIQEMEQVKGLNYGNYEFSFDHFAIILSEVHERYMSKTEKLIVAPIITKKRRNTIKLEQKFHSFLNYDSYIDLESIQHISLERIKIKESKRRLLSSRKELPIASPIVITNVKKELKRIFDL